MNTPGCEAKSWEYLYLTCSFSISQYAKKVEPRVTQRNLEKISTLRIHPMLIAGKFFEPDCLSPIESVESTAFTPISILKLFEALELIINNGRIFS